MLKVISISSPDDTYDEGFLANYFSINIEPRIKRIQGVGECFVLGTVDTGSVVLMISALSFLGLGAQPPTPEWGSMLADAKNVMTLYPSQMLVPGFAILLVVAALNFLGDAFRDAFDVRRTE